MSIRIRIETNAESLSPSPRPTPPFPHAVLENFDAFFKAVASTISSVASTFREAGNKDRMFFSEVLHCWVVDWSIIVAYRLFVYKLKIPVSILRIIAKVDVSQNF